MNNKYKIVKSEDWIQIYKNGKLLKEGRLFDAEYIFKLLGIEYEVEWKYEDDDIFD
jgi:hypothetical protein